ncbi:MAG: response regulator transcription factor [Spongiibacteraceae bacterium]
MKPCHVMLIDDHQIIREGLQNILEGRPDYILTSEVDSAEKGYELCSKQLPDLLIIDLALPGMGGIELLRRLKKRWPELKIMVFSIYSNPQLVKRAIEAGALSYVTKSSARNSIIEAIESTAQGCRFISPDLLNISDNRTSASKQSPLQHLTVKELEIFRLLTIGHATGEIALRMFISAKTVSNNISIIKKKLNVSSTHELIHLAIREGLIVNEALPFDK